MSYTNICKHCGRPFMATTTSGNTCPVCADKLDEARHTLTWARSDMKERGKCV
jgi:hypothetical protein